MNTAASAAIERAKRRPARPRPCRRRPPAPESGDTGATPPTPTRWRPGPISPPTPSRGGDASDFRQSPASNQASDGSAASSTGTAETATRDHASTRRAAAGPPRRPRERRQGAASQNAATDRWTSNRQASSAKNASPAPPRAPRRSRERRARARPGGGGHVVSVSRRSAPARSHRGAFRAVQWSWWCRWPCAASGVAEGRAVGCAALGGTGRGPAADDDGPPCCACPCCLPGAAWPPGP